MKSYHRNKNALGSYVSEGHEMFDIRINGNFDNKN